MSDSARTPWVMPEWMKPYEDLIQAGGNPVTEMMNDSTKVFINAPRAMIAVGVKGQVGLLTQLHERGLLGPDPAWIAAQLKRADRSDGSQVDVAWEKGYDAALRAVQAEQEPS